MLDLHYYGLAGPGVLDRFLPGPARTKVTRTFKNIVRTSNVRGLKKLTLRGWTLESADLLALLSMNPELTEVDFRSIALEGLWQPIFAHMTNPKGTFNRLGFDVLFENNVFVLLPHSPNERIQVAGVPAPSGWAACLLDGREAVLKGIAYALSAQWVMGCVQHSMWRQERSVECGPP